MSTGELNQALLWILRFAYPLTLFVLWRRILAWPMFGLYLLAVSVAAWAYDAWALKWTLITDAPTMALKIAATIEVLWRIFQHEPRKHRRVIGWILFACGLAGVAVTLGLQYLSTDPWRWVAYKTVRTGIHGGLFLSMFPGWFYGRFFGSFTPLHVWPHATIWTIYITLYATFAMVVPVTKDQWLEPVSLFRFGSLLCLCAWLWALGTRRSFPTAAPDRLAA